MRRQLDQTFERRLHILRLVALDGLALVIGNRGREQARAMQIEPGIERFLVERVDRLGIRLRDMIVPMCLRTTLAFLLSARALSLLCRGVTWFARCAVSPAASRVMVDVLGPLSGEIRR
ncbi:hypothetical protein [Accumulibacter sp.]|uniref:hypothetical protein n=1 Tax=Accumulibacter sp. TaxID=2053492 RepID=UPI00258CF9E7|nr:hypothetical protein [Accumulibacter sp.]